MPQLEQTPDSFQLRHSPKSGPGVSLQTSLEDADYRFEFKVIKHNLFRVSFHSATHPLPPHPSIIPPTTSISQNELDISETSSSRGFQAGGVTATVDWRGSPIVSLKWTDSDEVLHSDLPYRSYVVDGPGIAHYVRHDRQALHVGLGEAAAPMDLTGRNFKVDATDCFGYEPYKTSPMYKHMPFLVKATPQGCVAMVSSSYSRASWSVGAEIDGLWGHYKVYRQDYGGLDEYLIVGKTLKDVVRSYAELVGYPLLAPKWAFGYLSGGYKYTMQDDPPAHKYLVDFAAKLEEHDIPCSGHQMSSGYSISEVEPKVRNVFTWNKHRFPDPEAFLEKYHSLGIRLLSNIKPFILASHPDFEKLKAAQGMFTKSAAATPDMAYVRLWSAGGGESDVGGHLDFNCPTTYQWWVDGVRRLREQGVDAMWNDNNEYTLPNDSWRMALETESTKAPNSVGLWGRAMQTELMGKASYDGLLAAEPGVRPFVLTRSSTIGTMRYCCSSWSGDNMTSWEGMKGANAIGLTAGVSLLHQYGHDIGGFEGPQPSPELLLRWIQLGIYGPRFAINCFKTSPQDNSRGEVIEPWMYPEITPNIRKAIKRRYELMPYIYSLGLESHLLASPPQRWIGWGYESDPEVWSKRLKRGEEQYWFGDALLVGGGVYEPGVELADVYLPRQNGGTRQQQQQQNKHDFGYVNLNAPFDHQPSGQWIKVSTPWRDHIPVFAKVGSAVPVGKSVQTRMAADAARTAKAIPDDDYRGLEIFPPKGTSHGCDFASVWYEDDGLSLNPDISRFEVVYSSTDEKVTVDVTVPAADKFVPAWEELVVILPVGDERYVVSARGTRMDALDRDESGRRRYRLTGISKSDRALSNGYH